MVPEWFAWALLSTICNGTRAFLAKHVVEERQDVYLAQVLLPGAMVIVALPWFIADTHSLGVDARRLALAGGLQGCLVFMATMSRWEALRARAPAHVVFPIAQASTPFIIALSAVLFRESAPLRDPLHAVGIALAILSTTVLIRSPRSEGASSKGVGFALIAMVASVGATLAAKFAFTTDAAISLFGFIIISNLANLAVATVYAGRQADDSAALPSRTLLSAAVMGTLNFVGLFAFLQALQDAELSLVASVNALSLLVPIVLSMALYEEVLTIRKQFAILSSLGALLLLSSAS
jgi:uncharacterized membrane protein